MKRAIKFIFLLSLLVFGTNALQAQEKVDSSYFDKLYVDYSVPSITALSMLDYQSGEVETPGTIKELAVSLFKLQEDGRIKPELAIEFNPFLLFSKNRVNNLADYRTMHHWKTALQLSLATNADSLGTNVAFGFKWSPIDDSDPLMSPVLNQTIQKILVGDNFDVNYQELFIEEVMDSIEGKVTNRTKIAALDEIFSFNGGTQLNELSKDEVMIKVCNALGTTKRLLSKEDKRFWGNVVNKYIAYRDLASLMIDQPIMKSLAAAKAQFEEDNWNARRLQISAGYLLQSPDSSPTQLRNYQFALSSTYSLPIKNWGQFIGHVRYRSYLSDYSPFAESQFDSLPNSSSRRETASLFVGGRILVGGTSARALVEGALYQSFRKNSTYNNLNALVTLGVEFRIREGIWINAATGMNYDTTTSNGGKFFSTATLKYALVRQPKMRR